jgi:hypothetical protein
LPLKNGRGPTLTHDDKRNGTTTIFAALNALDGSVIGQNMQRHRLKHGVFHWVDDLQAAINRFIAEHNITKAKPFVWRADPDDIIAAGNRGFQMLNPIH